MEPRDGCFQNFFVAMVWMAVSLAAEVLLTRRQRAGGCRLHGLSTGAWPRTRLQWLKPSRSFAFLLFCLCFVLPEEVAKAATNARARGGKSFGIAPSVKKGARCVKQPKVAAGGSSVLWLDSNPCCVRCVSWRSQCLGADASSGRRGLGYYFYYTQGDRQCY